MIIGTLWPDRYTAYTTVPAPGGAEPHARERQVLDLADGRPHRPGVQPRRAGPGPRRRGPGSAAGGRAGVGRVRADPDPGGRTAAVARWEDAQTAHPYAWAVLTAALDWPGSAPAARSVLSSCAPPLWIIAPASSRPRRPMTGLSRPWPTPRPSCTAPPPPSALPGPAWARSSGTRRLRFELGPVELSLTVTVGREATPGAKIRFWVIEAGADARISREAVQEIKLVLTPGT